MLSLTQAPAGKKYHVSFWGRGSDLPKTTAQCQSPQKARFFVENVKLVKSLESSWGLLPTHGHSGGNGRSSTSLGGWAALWFCGDVNGYSLPEEGKWGTHYQNSLGNTESSKVKLGRRRPLCLSCVQVGFESPKWVMVIRGRVLLRTLLFEEKMFGEMLAEGNHGLPTICMSFFSYWVSACTFDKWENDTPPLTPTLTPNLPTHTISMS